MILNTAFPPVLLDDSSSCQSERKSTPCEHELAGRIWNVFDRTDLQVLSIDPDERRPILRIYDLELIQHMADEKLDHLPVILSHLIDLSDAPFPEHKAGIAIEVANRADLETANALPCSLVIGRSFESPGPSKESSAFIIYQLLKAESQHPFYIHGFTSFSLFQAYLASGTSGIVLPSNQFSSDAKDKAVRFSLGNHSIIRLGFAGGTPEAIAYRKQQEQDPENFLKQSFEQGLWSSESNDLWGEELREQTLEYLKLWELSPREATAPACFYEHSPAARKTNCRFPIFQGAMANITRSPDFSEAVAKQGALPCLALAGLSFQESNELVRETAKRQFPFAAGFVGLSTSAQMLEELVALFEEVRPTYVVVSTPQLDHVNRLLKTDLDLLFHAPNRAMFKALFDMGCRNFIIEGEEAGGHTSNIGGLTAWQGVLEEIRDQNLQNQVHLVFAGGIHNRLAADLLSSLLYFYGLERDLLVSLQLGTAYLSTAEATQLTALPDAYQNVIIDNDDTVITGESVHRNVRQIATSASARLLEDEWSIFASDLELDQKKRAYEKLYQGGLKLAITSSTMQPSGGYLAGAISTLLTKRTTIQELHEGLLQKAPVIQDKTFEPIAIVGIGSILPGANNLAEHFDNLLLKRCSIRDIPDSLWNRKIFLDPDSEESDTTYAAIAAMTEEIDSDLTSFRIPPSVSEEMSDLQIISLQCAHQALKDAGYYKRPFPKNRTGVIIGATKHDRDDLTRKIAWRRIRFQLEKLVQEGDYDRAQTDKLLEEYDENFNQLEIKADSVFGGTASLAAGRIASAFNFNGPTNLIDAACASSLAAIGQGVTLLQERRCDVVLSGGADVDLTAKTFIGYSRVQALSKKGSFPFDQRADGFVVGSGATLFVLKRYDDAIRNGDRIYALIQGWGASSDGAGKGAAAPDYKGQLKCLENAYDRARVQPSDVDFVECHATGTPVGDAEERKTVGEFFGKERLRDNRPPLPIAGSKAFIGHVRSAAGAASMLSSIFAINHRCVPPQVNFENAPEGVCFEKLGLHVAKRPEPIESTEVVAGTSAFGFGGINYHVILSSPPQNERSPVLDIGKANFPTFSNLRSDTAFVFPGQGSQFVGMLHEFKDHPEVAHLLEQADKIYENLSGSRLTPLLLELPSENPEIAKKQEETLRSTEVSQPAILLTSAVILEILNEQESIDPGLMLGHSLGEYTALYAAGILSFEDAFTLACLRGQLMSASRCEEAGSMIAIEGNEEAAQRLIDQVDGYATCANFNSYRQTVVSGNSETLRQILQLAAKYDIPAYPLNVARAFHSELVRDCIAPMREHLEDVAFNQTTTPVLACESRAAFPVSTETGCAMGEGDRRHCIDLLSRQVNHPVDFVSQINAAYESGIRRFIEVGPKHILTNLIDSILENKPLQSEFLNLSGTDMLQRIQELPQKLQQEVEIRRQPMPAQNKVRKKKRKAASSSPVKKDVSLIDQILETVSSISGYDPSDIDSNAEFERDLGIDTLKIFEILSRLRGDILPQEIENFRDLTSAQKILAAAESYAGSDSHARKRKAPSEIECYKHKMVVTATLSAETPLAPLDDFGIDQLDNPYDGDKKRIILARPLATSLRSTTEELIAELHTKINGLALRPEDTRPTEIHIVTYGAADQFYDAAFFAVETLAKVAGSDISNLEFSYTHFDAESIPEASLQRAFTLARQLPNTGKHVREDGRIYQGRIFQMDGLFGSGDLLPSLLTEEDVVLITGGARGIAAHLAQHLIDTTASRFILTGRKTETEEWIQALPDDRVSYLSADLTDPEAIRALDLGKENISLILHAAGIAMDQNILKKSSEEFYQVIATKTCALDDILSSIDTERLRGVVQFSSIAAFYGSHGQSDYAIANAMLNGTLNGGIPALSIGWPPWSEVGMATRGIIKDILETSGVTFISLEEGRTLFERLLSGFLLSPPNGTTRVVVAGETPGPYLTPYEEEESIAQPDPIAQYRLSDPDQKLQVDLCIDLDREPALRDHKFAGKTFIPGAIMLREMVRLVLENHGDRNRPFEFSDVEFLSPMIIREGTHHKLQLSRQNDFFIAELEEADHTRPIASLKLLHSVTSRSNPEANAKLLSKMQALASLRPTPFPIPILEMGNSEQARLKGLFAVVEHLEYNGSILISPVDLGLARKQQTILSDTGRVPFLLEAAFQTGSLWARFKLNTCHIFMPKHVGHCEIYYQRCSEASEAKVYCHLVEHGETVNLDIIVVDQDEQPLIVLRNYVSSPTPQRNMLPIRTIPTCAPFQIDGIDILALPLEEASQYALAHSDEIITETEAKEIHALPSSKRREEKLAGKLASKLLAQELLRRESDIPSSTLQSIEVLSDDSPVNVEFHAQQPRECSYFSISHSDRLACAARGLTPVGVDIERIRPLSEKAAADCCGEKLLREIQEYIDEHAPSDIARTFLKKALPILIFTQKEAVLKAAGIGIGEGLSGVEIDGVRIQSPTRAVYRGDRYEVTTTLSNDYALSTARLLAEEETSAQSAPITKAIRKAPLSLLQEAALYYEQTVSSEKASGYTLTLLIQLLGKLDESTLQKAFEVIVQKHDVLRMVFEKAAGRYTGFILDYEDVEISNASIEIGAIENLEESLLQHFDGDEQTNSNSAHAPLYKARLIQLRNEHHALQITFHHSIMDCFSALILGDEIMDIYEEILSGNEPSTRAPNSYADYILRERESLTPRRLESLTHYWSHALKGVDFFQPSAVNKPGFESTEPNSNPHYIDSELDPARVQQLDQTCREVGVTLFTGLLTALQSTLIKETDRNQCVVNIPFSSKDRILDQGATGPFIRLLPIRAELERGKTYESLLREQRVAIFDAIEHHDIPPGGLVEIIQKNIGGREIPPQVICQLIPVPETRVENSSLKVRTTVRDGINPHTYMILTFFQSKEGIRCGTTFNDELIDAETVARFLEQFSSELDRLCSDATQLVQPDAQGTFQTPASAASIASGSSNALSNRKRVQDDALNLDQLIDQISVIWQYALHLNKLDKDENFFDLGGKSLQAVEIASNIKNTFGIEFPLSCFVDAPTPALQAEILLSQDWESAWDATVALKASGNQPPFFCVHPSDGNILCYSDLAAAMGDDYPFYGLQAKGLNGKDAPLRDVIEMAQYYVEAIREIRPQGPYFIGGWSAGGVVAFEMAQQLRNQGEDVNLTLIDTPFPGTAEAIAAPLRETDKPSLRRRILNRLTGAPKQETISADELTREILFGDEDSPLPKGYQQATTLRSIWAEASHRYEAKPYPGKITLLLSEDYDARKEIIFGRLKKQIAYRNLEHSSVFLQRLETWELHSPLHWQHLAKEGLSTFTAPGDHHTLLDEQNSQKLAQLIMRCIEASSLNTE